MVHSAAQEPPGKHDRPAECRCERVARQALQQPEQQKQQNNKTGQPARALKYHCRIPHCAVACTIAPAPNPAAALPCPPRPQQQRQHKQQREEQEEEETQETQETQQEL
jgi:hypothetical protein